MRAAGFLQALGVKFLRLPFWVSTCKGSFGFAGVWGVKGGFLADLSRKIEIQVPQTLLNPKP